MSKLSFTCCQLLCLSLNQPVNLCTHLGYVYITRADVGIKVVKEPEDVVVKVGQKFRLHCKATHDWNEELKYEWFQDQAIGGIYMYMYMHV